MIKNQQRTIGGNMIEVKAEAHRGDQGAEVPGVEAERGEMTPEEGEAANETEMEGGTLLHKEEIEGKGIVVAAHQALIAEEETLQVENAECM